MKVYLKVKSLLEQDERYRNSDKEIFWKVMEDSGVINGYIINKSKFMEIPSFESYRRCRQKLQQLHPELRGSKWVQKARAGKAEQKGTFIYHEVISEQKKLL